eukprot:1655599-Rhodomonas_salina.2
MGHAQLELAVLRARMLLPGREREADDAVTGALSAQGDATGSLRHPEIKHKKPHSWRGCPGQGAQRDHSHCGPPYQALRCPLEHTAAGTEAGDGAGRGCGGPWRCDATLHAAPLRKGAGLKRKRYPPPSSLPLFLPSSSSLPPLFLRSSSSLPSLFLLSSSSPFYTMIDRWMMWGTDGGAGRNNGNVRRKGEGTKGGEAAAGPPPLRMAEGAWRLELSVAQREEGKGGVAVGANVEYEEECWGCGRHVHASRCPRAQASASPSLPPLLSSSFSPLALSSLLSPPSPALRSHGTDCVALRCS